MDFLYNGFMINNLIEQYAHQSKQYDVTNIKIILVKNSASVVDYGLVTLIIVNVVFH